MRYIFTCRATKSGAFTTVYGKKYGVSETGMNWMEYVDAEPGDIIERVDISSDGNHSCTKNVVQPDGTLVAFERANPHGLVCPVCGDQ